MEGFRPRLTPVGVIILLVGVGCLGQSTRIIQDRFLQQTGVLATKNGPARVLSALWTIVVVLDSPESPNVEGLLHQYDITMQAARTGLYSNSSAFSVWEARMDKIKNKLRLRPRTRVARTRRGAIDFVGYLGKKLFGLATVQDVNSIVDLVRDLQFSVDRANFNNDHMLTVLNATQEVISTLAHNIHTLDSRTRELASLVENLNVLVHNHIRAIQNLQLQDFMGQVLDLLELVSDSYAEAIYVFRTRLGQLDRGKLSRDILPEIELHRVLDQLRNKGHEVLPLHWYYSHLTVDPLWETPVRMAFQVVIPVISHEQCIAYSMMYVPVPISMNYTREIKGAPTIVLSTESATAFAPTDNSCMGRAPMVCYPALQLTTRKCETSMLNSKGLSDCNFVVKKIPEVTSMAYRNMNNPFAIVVVPFQDSEVLVRCPGKDPKKELIRNVTIFHLAEGCGLEGDQWRIAGVRLGVSNVNVSFDLVGLPEISDLHWPHTLPATLNSELSMHDMVTVSFPKLWEPIKPIKTVVPVYPRVPFSDIASNYSLSWVGIGVGTGSVVFLIIVVILYYGFIHRRYMRGLWKSGWLKAGNMITDMIGEESGPSPTEAGGPAMSTECLPLDIPKGTVKKLVNPR